MLGRPALLGEELNSVYGALLGTIATAGCDGEPGRGLGPAGRVGDRGSAGSADAMMGEPVYEELPRRPLFDLALRPRLHHLFGLRVVTPSPILD